MTTYFSLLITTPSGNALQCGTFSTSDDALLWSRANLSRYNVSIITYTNNIPTSINPIPPLLSKPSLRPPKRAKP